MGEVIKASWH